MKKRKMNRKGLLSLVLALCMIVTSLVFVPKKAEAAGSYWIKVNRKMNTVTVYQYQSGKYKPVKAMVCSVGKNGATPRGNYRTQAKYRWHTLMGNVHGQYCTRIYKGYLFHSVWYYSRNKSAQSTKEYNKLGKAASHGCVRLTVADSKWLYDRCPTGTKVTIYDSSKSGPLGKPKAIKVSRSSKTGWDPTDPDPKNPFSRRKPTIKFSSKKAKRVALYSSAYNVKSGVSARSYNGKNLTSRIKVSGKVNTKKPGTYTLTYTVKDSKGYFASRDFKVTVVKPSKPLLRGVKSSVTMKLGDSKVYKYMREGVSAIDRDGSNITRNMKLTCSDPSVFIAKNGKTFFEKPGTYKLTYSITGAKKNGARKTTKTTTVKVLDNSTPSISVSNAVQEVNMNTAYGDAEIRQGVSASTVKGTNLNDKLTYAIYSGENKVNSIDTSKAGDYTIKYSVISPTGRTAVNSRSVKVVDLSQPMVVNKTRNNEFEVSATASKEEKESKIKEGVTFSTQNGTVLTNWSYEIYLGGQPVGAPVSIDKMKAGNDYKVYLYCKNINNGLISQKSEQASKVIHVK